MPAVARQVKELLGKEPSHALNPDECVAMGAAIQAAFCRAAASWPAPPARRPRAWS